MYKKVIKTSEKQGMPPGALVLVGNAEQQDSIIRCTEILPDKIQSEDISDTTQILELLLSPNPVWIEIQGFNNSQAVVEIMNHFKLHALIQEDILNTKHRPTVTITDDYIFITCKRFYKQGKIKVVTEQISLVLAGNNILTIQETHANIFSPLHERIITIPTAKRIANYLYYTLLDCVVDSYYEIIEEISERLEKMEDALVFNPKNNLLLEISAIRHSLLTVKRNVIPMREIMHKLLREEEFRFQGVNPYLRDLYDHIIQIIEVTEMSREIIASLMDIYLSSVNNKMNEIMKVLTIISTTFIPLTFIAGVYGMNFEHMPELKYPEAYPLVLLVMLIIAIVMAIYFRWKKWF